MLAGIPSVSESHFDHLAEVEKIEWEMLVYEQNAGSE